MHASKLRSAKEFIALAGSFFPLFVIVFFYAFVLRARMHLGRWPMPYQPDPKQLGFDLHHTALFFSLLSVLPIAGATVLFITASKLSGREVRTKVLAYLVCLAVFVGWATIDPSNFLEWYFD